MAQNGDKQTFCAAWLKTNKNLICKAVITDVDGMNRDISVMECESARLQEIKTEHSALKNKLDLMERDLQENIRRRDVAEKREKELEMQIWELQESSYGTDENLKTVVAMLNEKDNEI
jgi:hypothetical protein